MLSPRLLPLESHDELAAKVRAVLDAHAPSATSG